MRHRLEFKYSLALSKMVKNICWFYINVYVQDGCQIILAIKQQQKKIVTCLIFKKLHI